MKMFIALLAVVLLAPSLSACSNDSRPGRQSSESDLLAVNSQNSSQKVRAANGNIETSRQNAITRAVEKCSPAVVGINVTEVRQYAVRDPFYDPFFEMFFGRREQRVYKQDVHSVGSGFLISADGYILSNDHVAGNASKIVVTLTNGEKYDAKIVGTDPTTDVALLKIEGGPFPFLELGNSDDVMLGEWAIAFGNPFGLFNVNAKPTITVGVVSNKGVNMMQENRVYRDMIQTDAAISSGNSGGPLVNAEGSVIGMNTIIFSTAQNSRGAGSIGIGFSIPINRVRQIVSLLKKDGKIDREFKIGFTVREVDDQLRKYLDLEKASGVVVYEVFRRTPAERAGFEPGDVIVDIDGSKVMREEDVQVLVYDGKVGDELVFTIQRGRETKKVTLKLEAA